MRRVVERDLPIALRVVPVSDDHSGLIPSASGRQSDVLEGEGAKKWKEHERRTDSCGIERHRNIEFPESSIKRILRRMHSNFSHSAIKDASTIAILIADC